MSGDDRDAARREGTDFIRTIVAKHNEENTYKGRVETRFPPEPNGYLHIGHTRPIVLNFGLAQENGGVCHLRFDDTNPLTEDMKYVRAIQEDIRWLGYDWGEHLYFASDYFDRLYESALILIRKGKAYVDSLSEDEIREYRGTVTKAGRDSPYRERSIEQNLDLFTRMKAGEFKDGEHVLRAKIDMAHPNMIMRDPILYRIRHASHYRRGDAWCIYPLYDFTHCLSDAFEDITHSLCSMEFENNREIYDWLLDEVGFEEPRTHQYEFGRMNLEYTIVSKRKLMRLVNEGHVDGWDDPRMPTIAGMRKRGIPPEAIVRFTESVGVAKVNNRVDLAKLEYTIRDYLNMTVPRVMGVLRPLKVVLTNYPRGGSAEGGGPGEDGEMLQIPSYPHDVPLEGSRMVPFSRELYIEADDFREDPPAGFFRLAPGREVRLRYAYFIRCDEVVKDPESGEVVELRCSYDPATKGGTAPDGRKVKGTIHWVSAPHALPAEVRLYDRLFTVRDPEAEEGVDFTEHLNPESKVVLERAYVEPSVGEDPAGTRYQFERLGYFIREEVGAADSEEASLEPGVGGSRRSGASAADSRGFGPLVFNRIVTLRDTWGKRAGEIPADEAGPGAPPGQRVHGTDRGNAERGAGETPTPRRDRRNTAKEARERARAKHVDLAAAYTRYQEELGLDEEDADLLAGSRELSEFFEAALAAATAASGAEGARDPSTAAGPAAVGAGVRGDPSRASSIANWIVNDLLRELKDRSLSAVPVTPEHLASLVALREGGTISQPVAKEIFAEMVSRGVDPEDFVKEKGLEKIDDIGTLKTLIDKILEDHPEKVQEYRAGKLGLLGFFMGQAMREIGGKADPKTVQDLLREGLGNP